MKTAEDNYYLSALLDGVYAPPLSTSNNKNVAWPFPKQQREILDIVTPSGLTDVASIDHRQTQVPGLARDDRLRDLHAPLRVCAFRTCCRKDGVPYRNESACPDSQDLPSPRRYRPLPREPANAPGMTYSAASGRDEVRVPVSGNVQFHRQDPAAPHAAKGESGKVGAFGYRRGEHGGEAEGAEVERPEGYL